MDDLHGVAVGQGVSHLLDVFAGSRLVKSLSLTFLETFVHLSSGSILEDQVDFGVVVKVSEETQNMRMSEQRAIGYFYLSYPLFQGIT